MRRIAADFVYTLAGEGPLRDAFVEVDDDGTVLRTGICDGSLPCERFSGAIVPGFVNAHCHVELSYLKGVFLKGTGMAGFIDQINALRNNVSREERILRIREWMDTMYGRGVSAMADISNCSDSFEVKASHPMYTRTFVEVFGDNPDDAPSVMESARSLAEEARELGLDAAPGPHACYTMSPRLLKMSVSDSLGEGFLSYHSQESSEEEMMITTGSGPLWDNRIRNGLRTPPVGAGSSLEYFVDTALAGRKLPVDGNVLMVHEVCMDEADAALAKKAFKHPFVALCPLSNLFIHNALPPVEMLRRTGIGITVGTDSLSSNDDLDMVAELRALQDAFPDVPLEELFSWACLSGARFLSRDDVLGSLEPGKRPGIVIVENLSPEGRLTADSRSRRIV